MTNDQQLMTKYRELREFVTELIQDDSLNESDSPELCRSAINLLDKITFEEKSSEHSYHELFEKYQELRDFVTELIHQDVLNESDSPEECRAALKLLDEIACEEKQVEA